MSLINDALKRAKQAQQDAPPPPLPPDVHFRPVDPPAHVTRHGIGLLLPISLSLVALLSLLLLWELSRRPAAPASAPMNVPLEVSARPLPAEPAAPAAVEAPPTSATTTPTSVLPSKPASLTLPQSAASQAEHGNNSAPSTATTSSTNPLAIAEAGDTNHAIAAVVPPALKLQGIVFNPRRPSAMINGRIVFMGDRFRDLRVAAIHADNVVLIGAGATNVLSLEP